MRLLDVLLGRTRPVKSKTEKLFAIATGYISLEARLQLKTAGVAGVCFRPVTSSDFADLAADLKELLRISAQAADSRVRTDTDSYGFQWVILEDKDFEDLVATIHLVSQTLTDQGFGGQLLAAVFKFLDGERPVYWIYSYKRGNFYPFVPAGRGEERDNAYELRLRSVMEHEMPLETELERWYALWGLPF